MKLGDVFEQVVTELGCNHPPAYAQSVRETLRTTKEGQLFLSALDKDIAPEQAANVRGALLTILHPSVVGQMSQDEQLLSMRLRSAAMSRLIHEQSKHDSAPPIPLDRAFFTMNGNHWFPHSYAVSGDDLTALSHMSSALPDLTRAEQDAMVVEEYYRMAIACARWAEQAFPVVQLAGHKYAAALMATKVPSDIDVRPPWRAFLIELPDHLLHIRADSDHATTAADESVRYVLVHVLNMPPHTHYLDPTAERVDRWSFAAYGTTLNLHRHGMYLNDLLEPSDLRNDDPFESPTNLPVDTRDNRTMRLVARLIVNVCLTMSSPEHVTPVGHAGAPTRQGRNKPDAPTHRIFRIGKPVSVDCRSELTRYLDGVRASPVAVQFLVRGHWRNQSYGPGHSLRRPQWIEPFWKGLDGAPINIRPHVLGKRNTK